MKGGDINAISDLVFRNVPMIRSDSLYKGFYENTIQVVKVKKLETNQITWTDVDLLEAPEKKVYISDEWIPYIQFIDSGIPSIRFTLIKLSFKEGINPNTHNSRGQTLLFIAALNCNKIIFDSLVAMGASLSDRNSDGTVKEKNSDGTVKGINIDGSNVLHGIAWGGLNAQDRPIKTYEEKVAFMQEILQRYPRETIPLLFQVNIRGETCYDNLLMRHPDKISKSLEDVAFPFGWKRGKNPDNKIVYVNPRDNISYLQRPY
jgi:hypothetical protein